MKPYWLIQTNIDGVDTEPMIAEDEKWKDIIGYEGLYQVSNFGRVKRIASASGTHPGRILSPFTDRQKYLVVTLCNASGHRKFYVHRLVIEAFIGPYPEGHECRHLNGNRQNNRLYNLSTGTHNDNVGDTIRHGTHTALNQYGCDNPLSKMDVNQVLEIRNLYENYKISQKDLAIRFGVCQATINQIINRKTWRHILGNAIIGGFFAHKCPLFMDSKITFILRLAETMPVWQRLRNGRIIRVRRLECFGKRK